MKRKQRKSRHSEGGLDYVILIIITYGEHLLWFSPRIINEKLYQTLKRAFHQISTHFKVGWKNWSVPHFFNPLLSVWPNIRHHCREATALTLCPLCQMLLIKIILLVLIHFRLAVPSGSLPGKLTQSCSTFKHLIID